MFCPFCGVKNNAGLTQCFVCAKKLPSLDSEVPVAVRPRPERVARTPGAPAAARLGDRLLAVILDTALLSAAALVSVAAIATDWSRLDRLRLSNAGLVAVTAGTALLVVFLYCWILEGAFGATIGKAIIGLRVSAEPGRTRGFRASAVRNAFRLVDGLPLYLPGLFIAAFSAKRRRLGDYAAHTFVVEQAPSLLIRLSAVILWLAAVIVAVWGAVVIQPDWFRDWGRSFTFHFLYIM